ncbi:DUF6207 family protein [Streptomyces lydicus]|uniref:DUF6207 family protein n=1 Tax=Streptomyces lydicus TaxID=47763 RepID=UPI003680B716
MDDRIDEQHLGGPGLLVIDITAADEASAQAAMAGRDALWMTSGAAGVRRVPGEPGVRARVHAALPARPALATSPRPVHGQRSSSVSGQQMWHASTQAMSALWPVAGKALRAVRRGPGGHDEIGRRGALLSSAVAAASVYFPLHLGLVTPGRRSCTGCRRRCRSWRCPASPRYGEALANPPSSRCTSATGRWSNGWRSAAGGGRRWCASTVGAASTRRWVRRCRCRRPLDSPPLPAPHRLCGPPSCSPPTPWRPSRSPTAPSP